MRAWLCGIARNLSKTELRGRRRDVSDIDAIQDVAAGPHALIEASEAERVLRSALDELPATYREPLVLFYWQDQSIEHVATALEITAQAAQKRISRARTMIGDELVARLDTTARGRRSAKAAAAAIVAVLATGGARVSEAARRSVRKTLPVGALTAAGAIVAAMAVATVVWIVATPRSSASPIHDEPAEAVERASASAAPHLPASQPSVIVRDVATSYTILPLPAPHGVTVDLTGEPPPLVPPVLPPADPRHIRGRVVDATGKPVAGVVVAVGMGLRSETGTLFATLPRRPIHAAITMSLHLATRLLRSWPFIPSPVGRLRAALPTGPRTRSKTSAVTSGWSFRCRAAQWRRYRGEDRRQHQQPNVDFVVQTDANGKFALPLLPPATTTYAPKERSKWVAAAPLG